MIRDFNTEKQNLLHIHDTGGNINTTSLWCYTCKSCLPLCNLPYWVKQVLILIQKVMQQPLSFVPQFHFTTLCISIFLADLCVFYVAIYILFMMSKKKRQFTSSIWPQDEIMCFLSDFRQ